MANGKKTTVATVKAFIRKNLNNLFIDVHSSFDGMIDGLQYYKDGFEKAVLTDKLFEHTQGVSGAWFAGRSRDSISDYAAGGHNGFHIYNSGGSFTVAVKDGI